MAKTKDTKEQASAPVTFNVIEQPTAKQQLVSAGVQIGIALAVPVTIAVVAAVASGVSSVKAKYKEQKAKRQSSETTDPATQE